MKKFIVCWALVLGGVLGVACGGGEPEGPRPVSFSVEGFDEFRYEPAELTAETRAEVTLTFSNEGNLDHNWILVTEATDLENVQEEDALAGTVVGLVPSGESRTIQFIAPTPGIYSMVCTVPGHAIGGMIGTFTVTGN